MARGLLSVQGWHLTVEGTEEFVQNGNKSTDAIIKVALDTDIKNIGEKTLPNDISRGKVEYIQGPCVLQIQKIRNISAPKDNEESQAAPRLLKLTLTDGHVTCIGVELESISSISLNTPPGSKVRLVGTVVVESGFLQLNCKNTKLLGGRVEKLLENWELKRQLAKEPRASSGGVDGPPPFVPFGQRICKQQLNQTDNFKSLELSKEKKSESGDFEMLRQATIAEALQAKEDGKAKTFGGGNKQYFQDGDVARLIDMGFSVDQATSALKLNNGNVNQAINSLVSRGGVGGGPKQSPQWSSQKPERASRGKKGGKGKENIEGDDLVPSRPSGPATLFDFLETKIPLKEESKASTERTTLPGDVRGHHSRHNNDASSNFRPDIETGQKTSNNRRNNLPPRLSGKPSYTCQNYGGNMPQNCGSNSSHGYSNQGYSFSNPGQRNWSNISQSPQSYNSSSNTGYSNNSRHGQSNSNLGQAVGNSPRQPYNNSAMAVGGHHNIPGQGYGRYDQKDNRQTVSILDNPNKSTAKSDPNQSQPSGGNNNSLHQGGSQRTSVVGSNMSYDRHADYIPGSNNSLNRSRGSSSFRHLDAQDPCQQSYRTPEHKQQQHYERRNIPSPANHQISHLHTEWQRGDRCLAKYWEDGQFYNCVVEAVVPNLPTCVVTFTDYGNSEEVMLSDIKPLSSKQHWSDGATRHGSQGVRWHGNQSQQSFPAPPPPHLAIIIAQNSGPLPLSPPFPEN